VGIRTRTVPNGGESEISIDDNPFTEKILVRASGDFVTEVARNTRTELGGTYNLTVAQERRELTNADASFAFATDVTVKVEGNHREEIGEDRAEIVLGSVNEYVEGDVSRVVGGRVDAVTQGAHSHVFGADSIERHIGHHAVVVAAKDSAGQASAVLHVEGAARAYAKNLIEAVSLEGFTFSCGDSHVTIRKDSVTIASPTITLVGKTVQVTASDTAAVAAKTVTIAGSDSVTVSGANKATLAGQSATVVLDSNATVQGSAVKLGSGGGSSSSSQAQPKTVTVTTIKLADGDGNPVTNQRAILRKGGNGGPERVVALDAEGQIMIEGDDALDVLFAECRLTSDPQASGEMHPYTVRQGDYVGRLASRSGFDPDTVWNHEKNEPLRKAGRDANVLHPGDVLYIPDAKKRWQPVKIGGVNKFVAPSSKVPVCLQFGSCGKSWSGEAYTIEGADIPPGSLDSDGKLSANVSTHVESFVVMFPDRKERRVVHMGYLDPPETYSGLAQRLQHLGYLSTTAEDDDLDVQVRVAITRLQVAHELPVTGELDDQTRSALADEHKN
jgi:Putative peptidoglycan binding domain